jgi:hypothetical protein
MEQSITWLESPGTNGDSPGYLQDAPRYWGPKWGPSGGLIPADDLEAVADNGGSGD